MKLLQKRYRPLLLTVISQIGFLVLISFWVKNSYETEKKELQREASFFLQDQISSIDRNRWQTALQKIFISQYDSIPRGKDGRDTTLNLGKIIVKDSIFSRLPKRGEFEVNNDRYEADTVENALVSVYTSKEDSTETLFLATVVDSIFMKSLNKRLESVQEAGNYDLIPIPIEEFEPQKSGFYTVRFEGRRGKRQKMIAEIINYRPYLFRKVLPETLLSLLLLIFSGIAFLLMGKTIRKQRIMGEQQRNFMYNMTHELKTPITTIGLAVESLKNNDLPEVSKKNYLELSSQSLVRLNTLINKVLGSAKFENGKVELEKTNTNVLALVNGLAEEHNFILREKQKPFQINTSFMGTDIEANIDQYHVRNAINNLLDNAIKYSKDVPEVDLTVQQNNGTVEIAVKDNGPGIDKAEIPYLFDKFYRVNDGKRHDVKGFGLGLHYAYQVAEQHGGSLSVQSKAGKGSTFILKLPVHG